MALNTKLQSFIQQLASDMAMPGELKTGDDNIYKMLFGKDLQVTISMDSDHVIQMTGVIGSLPQNQTEAFLTYAAFGNLLGEGTGDSIISLDNEGKLLYLNKQFPVDVPYTRFKEEVEVFLNYLEMWQKKREDATKKEASYRSGILQP